MVSVLAPAAAAREQIVGGTVALPGAWPSTVALINPSAPDPVAGQFCGGTLIATTWVVTAAHCTYDLTTTPPTQIPASGIDVLAGAPDLGSVLAGAQRRAVLTIIRAPGFDPTPGGGFPNDVALLQLDAPILPQATPRIATMGLPATTDASRWAPLQRGLIAGWGSTVETGAPPFSAQLKQADVFFQFAQTCINAYPGPPALYSDSIQICADNTAIGNDACVGDSGGPLVIFNSQGFPRLVGITSFGAAGACGSAPTVFARTSNGPLRTFINTQLNLKPPDAPTALTAAPGPRTVSLTWQPPPASTPARDGFDIRVLRSGEEIASREIADPAATQTTFDDLEFFEQGRGVPLTYSVRAYSDAGQGPAAEATVAALPRAPFFRAQPALSGTVRVRNNLVLSPGQWAFPDGAPVPGPRQNFVWESCSADGVTCAPLPLAVSGTTLTIPVRTVGRRIRAVEQVVSADGTVVLSANSPQSAVVPPTLAGHASRRVATGDRGITLTGNFATQKGSRVQVQVLNERGKPMRLDARASRINGRVASQRERTRLGITTTVSAGHFRLVIPTTEAAAPPRVRIVISTSLNGSANTRLVLPVTIPR